MSLQDLLRGLPLLAAPSAADLFGIGASSGVADTSHSLLEVEAGRAEGDRTWVT
jgi:hypothetical protein